MKDLRMLVDGLTQWMEDVTVDTITEEEVDALIDLAETVNTIKQVSLSFANELPDEEEDLINGLMGVHEMLGGRG